MPCTAEEIFATDSAASGMAVLARASLASGDEVLIPDPVDFLLHHTVQQAGAIPVRVRVGPGTSAEEFIRSMEARLTRTRMNCAVFFVIMYSEDLVPPPPLPPSSPVDA